MRDFATFPAQGPKHSILLVEDESAMLEVMREYLVLYGHEVVKAKGGDEAKARLAQREFDVVVTDLWMPGGSGSDLIVHLRREYPGVGVVVVTAQPRTLLPPEMFSGEFRIEAVIEKPFLLAKLAEAVAAAGERARLNAGLVAAIAQ